MFVGLYVQIFVPVQWSYILVLVLIYIRHFHGYMVLPVDCGELLIHLELGVHVGPHNAQGLPLVRQVVVL